MTTLNCVTPNNTDPTKFCATSDRAMIHDQLASINLKAIDESIMFKFSSENSFIFKLLLSFLLIILITTGIHLITVDPVKAQSDTAVRSELVSLRNRLSRLESQVGRLLGSQGGRGTSPTPSGQRNTPQVVDGELIGESDPMFERLATLVIEIREQVRTLEKRVTTLEGKLNRGNR